MHNDCLRTQTEQKTCNHGASRVSTSHNNHYEYFQNSPKHPPLHATTKIQSRLSISTPSTKSINQPPLCPSLSPKAKAYPNPCNACQEPKGSGLTQDFDSTKTCRFGHSQVVPKPPTSQIWYMIHVLCISSHPKGYLTLHTMAHFHKPSMWAKTTVRVIHQTHSLIISNQ